MVKDGTGASKASPTLVRRILSALPDPGTPADEAMAALPMEHGGGLQDVARAALPDAPVAATPASLLAEVARDLGAPASPSAGPVDVPVPETPRDTPGAREIASALAALPDGPGETA